MDPFSTQTMIISHTYRFIFLKTNKTAGTSIEIALSRFCGDEDVITPVSPKDEETRRRLGYRGPQNYWAPRSDYGVRDLARLWIKGKKKIRYYNHMPAEEVRTYVGEDLWRSYYTFCFERNPWDRFISFYYWRCKTEPRPTISEFLETDAPLLLKKKGFELYTIDGEIAVDRVCLYEKLQEELEGLRVRLGFPEAIVLPEAKSSFRKDRRTYRDILNDAEKEKISDLFSAEIALFGYEY